MMRAQTAAGRLTHEEGRRYSLQGASSSLARYLVSANDWGVLALLVWNVVPEMWTKPMAIGPLPIPFLLTVFLSVSILFESTFYRRRLSVINLTVTAAILYSAARGWMVSDRNHWDLKFFIVDLWSMQAFLLGLLWASRRSLSYIAYQLRSLAPTFLAATIFTCIGLLAGVLHPVNGEYSNRLYTSSLWCLAIISFLVWPILHYATNDWENPRPYRFPKWCFGKANASVVLASGIFVAIFTATRNMFIISVVVFLVGRAVEKRFNTVQTLRLFVVIVSSLVLLVFLASVIRMRGTSVLERLTDTQVKKEQRWEEATGMFNQLGPDVVTGWGIGSRFYSPVQLPAIPLADAPHIGLLVGFLKGGFVIEGIFVILPLVLGIRRLVHRTPTSCAGAVCVIGFWTLSALSGGWFAYQLFLFGVGIGLLAKKPFPVIHPPRPVFSTARRHLAHAL